MLLTNSPLMLTNFRRYCLMAGGLLLLTACPPKPEQTMTLAERIGQAEEVEAFLVAERPTPPHERQPSQEYLAEYATTGRVSLTDGQADSLKQYLKEAIAQHAHATAPAAQKRCPFVGGYGLKLDAVEVVFSPDPCAKLIVKADTNTLRLDLPEASLLQQLLVQE